MSENKIGKECYTDIANKLKFIEATLADIYSKIKGLKTNIECQNGSALEHAGPPLEEDSKTTEMPQGEENE